MTYAWPAAAAAALEWRNHRQVVSVLYAQVGGVLFQEVCHCVFLVARSRKAVGETTTTHSPRGLLLLMLICLCLCLCRRLWEVGASNGGDSRKGCWVVGRKCLRPCLI
jgi:hypothetical protein